MNKKKYKVTLLQPMIDEEIIIAESMEDCYDKMMNIINSYPNFYLNIQIEEMEDEEDEENEQQNQ